MDLCSDRGIGVVLGAPFCSGILATGAKAKAGDWQPTDVVAVWFAPLPHSPLLPSLPLSLPPSPTPSSPSSPSSPPLLLSSAVAPFELGRVLPCQGDQLTPTPTCSELPPTSPNARNGPKGAVAGAKYCYEDATSDILDKVGKMEAICTTFNVPLAAVALQFPLGHPVRIPAGHA